MATVGSQLISELRSRKQFGMYFDFASYRKLRKIDSLAALSRFVNERGFYCPSSPEDVAAVANSLESEKEEDAFVSSLFWAAVLDPTGVIALVCWPFWLLLKVLGRIAKKTRA